ncbi:MAG: S41 family peptidase, partial [Verrucomicrobiota bacterium]
GMPEPFAPNVRLDWAEGKLCVAQSQVATLMPGDALLAVEEVPIEKAVEATLRQLSAPSPQGRQWLVAQHLLTGEKGTACRIRIEPFEAPGTSREITLTRDTHFYKTPRPSRERIKEVTPGLFYIDLEQWTAAEFQASWEKLSSAKGVIFDFRNYPDKLDPFDFFAHLTLATLHSPQWHLPIPTRPDHEGLEFALLPPWVITPRKPLVACRKIFLINAGCVSFAESCLGIVEHYKLGELVGGPTIGTNGNINRVKLPGGYTLTWTGMKVLKHDGNQHHGIGIRPTVPVEPTRAAFSQGRDEMMEKALEIVTRPDSSNSTEAGAENP